MKVVVRGLRVLSVVVSLAVVGAGCGDESGPAGPRGGAGGGGRGGSGGSAGGTGGSAGGTGGSAAGTGGSAAGTGGSAAGTGGSTGGTGGGTGGIGGGGTGGGTGGSGGSGGTAGSGGSSGTAGSGGRGGTGGLAGTGGSGGSGGTAGTGGSGGTAGSGGTGGGTAGSGGAAGSGGTGGATAGTGGSGGSGGTGGNAAPTITMITPAMASTGVSVNTTIVVEFSEAMNQTMTSVSLTPAVTLMAPAWNAAGNTVTLTPSAALQGGQTYTVNVTGKDLSGSSLIGGTTFTFTTRAADTTPPTIVSTSPANAATNVATNATISVTFSEPMLLTGLTLTLSPTVTQSEVVLGTGATVASITGPLAPATTYTVTVAGKDQAGNALAGLNSFVFTTASPPDNTAPTVTGTVPANAATGVATQSSIAITFSERMNATMTSAAITISPAVTCQGGWLWNAEGTFTSCQSSSALAGATMYTVTIGTGARDTAGNQLGAAAMFSFTTAAAPDTTAPTITSVTPANNAVGVAVDTNIVVTFSEPMDLASAQTAFQISAPTGVTGTFAWSNGGATMTFNPAADFANGTVVTFQVNMAAKDAAGNMKTTVNMYQFTVIRRGTATLTSEPGVDGNWFSMPTVNSNGTTFTAGDTAANLYNQGYLSFGLNLPGVTAGTEAQTRIVTATLQITQTSSAGTPFTALGALRFEHVYYGPTLETDDVNSPVLSVVTTTDTSAVKSVSATTAVTDDWTNRTARSSRSQYRVRFTTNTDADNGADNCVFATGDAATAANRPTLTVTYDYP